MIDYSDVDEYVRFRRKDKAKIVKYIELCFGKDSPLNEIENLRNRQIKACQKVKLNTNNIDVIQILDFNDKEVNVLINTYLGKICNNNLYDSLISNQYLFWTIQEEIRTPLDGKGVKHKTELSKYAELIEERITKLMTRIYGVEEVVIKLGAEVIRMSYEQRVKEKSNV